MTNETFPPELQMLFSDNINTYSDLIKEAAKIKPPEDEDEDDSTPEFVDPEERSADFVNGVCNNLANQNVQFDAASMTVVVKLKNNGPGETRDLAETLSFFEESIYLIADVVEIVDVQTDHVRL